MPSDMSIWENIKYQRGAVSASAAAFNSRLGSSYLGRSLQMGAAESFGFTYSSMGGTRGAAQGFLGQRGAVAAGVRAQAEMESKLMREAVKKSGAKGAAGQANALRRAQNSKWIQKEAEQAGKMATRGARIGGAAFGALNLAFTGLYAYQGWKEGGAIGAAKGVGESILWSAGIRAVGGLLNPYTLAAGAVAATAYGAYKLGEAGIAHEKNIRQLEFGGGEQMQNAVMSAGAATHRQRAVTALNNTHLNGRMSMGNEGLLSHTPWR